MRRIYLIVAMIVASLLTIACRKDKGEESVTENPDSLLTPFPDTMYASVEGLEYVIDTFDTSRSGNITDLSDQYEHTPGIFCFRGNAKRQMPYSGTVKGRPTRIDVDWAFTTAYDSRKALGHSWGGGSGWTGQPVYVKWPDSLAQRIRQENRQLTPDFKGEEIIVASLCSNIYFIDPTTGKATRQPMPTYNPIKGSASLDPRLNGNYYVGQALPCSSPFGAMVFNLITGRQTSMYDRDPQAWRNWGAYDSNAILAGDFLIRPAENGTLYKMYSRGDSLVKHTTLRYRAKRGGGAPGIESSIAICRNYGYMGDNFGNVLCVNLNTMKPVWYYWNHDDTDATIVVEEENGTPYLYTSCECDKQGENGFSYLTKLNGLNGDTLWTRPIACHKRTVGGTKREGGMFATPLIGHGNCEGSLFACFCTMGNKMGRFCRIDKKTGRVLYSFDTEMYLWNSPIAYYNEKNELFVLIGDVAGKMYLIDGATGEIIVKQQVGTIFESSPVPLGNSAIVGSRGDKIYKVTIR